MVPTAALIIEGEKTSYPLAPTIMLEVGRAAGVSVHKVNRNGALVSWRIGVKSGH